MKNPTPDQIERAYSFLQDKGATRKQKAIARAILYRNDLAAFAAGQMDFDELHPDRIPEDDF